jgi:hypothetical protein
VVRDERTAPYAREYLGRNIPRTDLRVPWAYALVEDPERPGKFFSVELRNVVYESIAHIEPSARSESLGSADERLTTAVHLRGRRRGWNT